MTLINLIKEGVQDFSVVGEEKKEFKVRGKAKDAV